MSKKLIAAMVALTILFVCVFAACNKDKDENRPYIEKDEYEFVTDEDGSRVYSEDGEFLVYATDDKGKQVTNENGEKETLRQPFQPVDDDGVYEEYGYKMTLPEGWKATDQTGVFTNKEKTQQLEISAVNQSYQEYYTFNKNTYKQLSEQEGVSVTWEDDVKFSDKCENVVRFTMSTEKGTTVMYFFTNSENTYKLMFSTTDKENAVKDSLDICKAISYKPYKYFPETDE